MNFSLPVLSALMTCLIYSFDCESYYFEYSLVIAVEWGFFPFLPVGLCIYKKGHHHNCPSALTPATVAVLGEKLGESWKICGFRSEIVLKELTWEEKVGPPS